MRRSASNASTVASLDNAIEAQQQAMRVARSGPTTRRFADVGYDPDDGQFRSRSSDIVANQVISATGITVDVPPRQSHAHSANQVISPDPTRHWGSPTHLVWRDLPFRAARPPSDPRGVIIIMPDIRRPFANNGKPSPHECRHYHLVVAT